MAPITTTITSKKSVRTKLRRSDIVTPDSTEDENDYPYDKGNDGYESGGYASSDDGRPFLPLEEQNQNGKDREYYDNEMADDDDNHKKGKGRTVSSNNNPLSRLASYVPQLTMKTVVSCVMFSLIFIIIWDAIFTDPKDRLLKPEDSTKLLLWVQKHPLQGLIWLLLLMAACVVLMIPLGTPLTLGCGYIYKGAYGWKLGVTIATIVSMCGSALGAVCCFLLGRYLMRDTVRKWIRKYPLFDAIDVAAAEHGLRIMAMLYLTPILPLGPVSYMCGTTSMALSSFVLAKVAALPLMTLYVFIGASTGALIGSDPSATAEEVKSIEENEYLIASGILLSFVTIGCITHYIKKELNKILERQQKIKPGETEQEEDVNASEEAAIEMGITRRRVA